MRRHQTSTSGPCRRIRPRVWRGEGVDEHGSAIGRRADQPRDKADQPDDDEPGELRFLAGAGSPRNDETRDALQRLKQGEAARPDRDGLERVG